MKTIINYTLKYVNIIIFVLIITTIVNITLSIKNIDSDENYIMTASLSILPSNPRIINDVEEDVVEDTTEEDTNKTEEVVIASSKEETIKEEIIPEEEEEKPVVVKPKPITYQDTSSYEVLATYTGNVSHYSGYCSGCGGRTATGYNVLNGNIYYNDATFGMLRILAGDASIPFGTIIRMNINGSTILGIVLDRGGIGFGKRFLFDLLVETDSVAYQEGVKYSVKSEVLRFGY